MSALAAASFACGARTAGDWTLDVAADASGDAHAIGAALTIPVGTYPDCAVTTIELRRNLEAAAGGKGTVTLSADGAGRVSAALSFGRWLSGTVTATPTSGNTAALSPGPFDLQTMDTTFASALTVSVTAGSFARVGDTLFVSIHGHGGDTELSGYLRCAVPAALPVATIVEGAPSAGPIPTGTYVDCTTFSGSPASGASGGKLSLTIAESKGTWTATQTGGFPDVCALAFGDVAGTTGTLVHEQTCAVHSPCGPPPTLVPSPAPRDATLTNMAGSIAFAGGVLFIDVLGDAPPEACGRHTLSLICPTAP